MKQKKRKMKEKSIIWNCLVSFFFCPSLQSNDYYIINDSVFSTNNFLQMNELGQLATCMSETRCERQQVLSKAIKRVCSTSENVSIDIRLNWTGKNSHTNVNTSAHSIARSQDMKIIN